MKKALLFLLVIFCVEYAHCTPYQYYKLTITANGYSGAQFWGGFAGFSELDALGTNIFSNYGSILSESAGWNWRGNTFSQMATFQAGYDPYISNGNEKWFVFQLDQARTIGSFKLGNYLREGSRWWIETINIEASHDNLSYQTLYSGSVSTSQQYTTINLESNMAPEPSSILLIALALAGIFLKKR